MNVSTGVFKSLEYSGKRVLNPLIRVFNSNVYSLDSIILSNFNEGNPKKLDPYNPLLRMRISREAVWFNSRLSIFIQKFETTNYCYQKSLIQNILIFKIY